LSGARVVLRRIPRWPAAGARQNRPGIGGGWRREPRFRWGGLGLAVPGGWELGGPNGWGAGGCGAVLAVAAAPAGRPAGAAVPLEPLVARGRDFPAIGRRPAGCGEGWGLRRPAAG
jgi:hypothetical protein